MAQVTAPVLTMINMVASVEVFDLVTEADAQCCEQAPFQGSLK